MLVHQEYQRGLHVFEDWLEQEQATLASSSHPEGNVDTLEKTLQQLQVLIVWGVVDNVIDIDRQMYKCKETLLSISVHSYCHHTWLKPRTLWTFVN